MSFIDQLETHGVTVGPTANRSEVGELHLRDLSTPPGNRVGLQTARLDTGNYDLETARKRRSRSPNERWREESLVSASNGRPGCRHRPHHRRRRRSPCHGRQGLHRGSIRLHDHELDDARGPNRVRADHRLQGRLLGVSHSFEYRGSRSTEPQQPAEEHRFRALGMDEDDIGRGRSELQPRFGCDGDKDRSRVAGHENVEEGQ